MPTYEYCCKSCGEHLEVFQSFTDKPITECPRCGGQLRKVFGNIGISFKGSGFYRTDSRPAPKTEAGSGKDGGSQDGGSKDGGAAKKEPAASGSSGSSDSSGSDSAGSPSSSSSGSSSGSSSSNGDSSSSSAKAAAS